MKPKSQLEALAEQFAHWRANREKSSNTPPHLVKAVVDIIDHYPNSEIVKALGINNSALKRWKNQYQPSSLKTEFIELGPSDPISPALNIEIQWGDLTLRVSGSSLDLAGFVKQLAVGK